MIICRSRAIDHLRRCDVAESNPDPGTLADEAMFAGSNPQDLLLAVERSTRLRGALERLSAVQRQLPALAFFKGLSHHELAKHTGMPLGTVKTHLRKALGQMRTSLDDYHNVAA